MLKYSSALKYLLFAYIVVTIAAAAAYYISKSAMWTTTFTFGPLVFGYFFYLYLKEVKPGINNLYATVNKLILFWIVLSFAFDAMIYIAVLPIIFGNSPNWTFFIDQSPWIWLNYLAIVLLGYISRLVYNKKHLK